jgi:hypothetical protein
MSLQQYNPKNDHIIFQVDSIEEVANYNIKGENGQSIELIGSNRLTANQMEVIKENGIVLASNTEGIKEGDKVYFFYNVLENNENKLDEANKIFSVRVGSLIAVEAGYVVTPLNDWVLAEWVYEEGVQFENGFTFKQQGSLVIPVEAKPLENTAKIVYCEDKELIDKVVLIDKGYKTKTYSVINGKKMLRFKYEDIHAILD